MSSLENGTMKRKQRIWEDGVLGYDSYHGNYAKTMRLMNLLVGTQIGHQTFVPVRIGTNQFLGSVQPNWNEMQDKFDLLWNAMFQLLKQYKAENGHVEIPETAMYAGEALGNWVANQRLLALRGLLKADRKARLDDLGFDWKQKLNPFLYTNDLQVMSKTWMNNFVPSSIIGMPVPSLTNVEKQHCSMEYPRKITEPDPVSSAQEETKMLNWEVMFQRLKIYKEEHGHCRVPTNYEKGCEGLPSKLGNWVLVQSRDTFAKAKSGHPLYVDRKNRLDALGFEWESVLSYRWEDMFERLKRFQEKHGHCRVPSTYDDGEGGPALGYWVRRQQSDIPPRVESGKILAIERKQRLDDIGFEWSKVFDAKWQAMFDRLKRFKEEHGHCRVPLSHTENDDTAPRSNLGRWCHEQRRNIPDKLEGNDSVYEERKQLLDSIGFDWKIESEKERKWNMMFERLQEFKREHGHCRVPKNYETQADDVNLAFWVRTQQEKVPKNAEEGNPVYIERKEKLDSIGFEWSGVHTEQWETMFKRLLDYKEKHGNTRVPYRAPNECEEQESQTMLGIWVYAQRSKLPPKVEEGDPVSIERKQRLDGIGFEWDSTLSSKWDIMYCGLKRFKQKFGHCRVPRSYEDDEEPLPANLGSWVITQRRAIATKAANGDETSIARKICLDAIGFHWARTNAAKS